MPWFVIYTKFKSEKAVAQSLIKKNIEVYCPVRKVQRKWSDRVKVIEEPLFKSYCFVHLKEEERYLVFDVPGVINYLYWLNKPAVVKEKEIEVIKDFLNDFEHDEIEVSTFSEFDKVTIKSGVFMNQDAEVVSTKGKTIVVKIESLGIYLSIDTSKNKVKKTETPVLNS